MEAAAGRSEAWMVRTLELERFRLALLSTGKPNLHTHGSHRWPASSTRWQADTTHWRLADGTDVEILNLLDDHPRLLLLSDASPTIKAADVVQSLFATRAPSSQANPRIAAVVNGLRHSVAVIFCLPLGAVCLADPTA